MATQPRARATLSLGAAEGGSRDGLGTRLAAHEGLQGLVTPL